MKIRVPEVFSNTEKEAIVFNQKDLNNIFGECFCVFSNESSEDVSYGDIYIFSRSKSQGYSNVFTQAHSLVEDYKKEELKNFIVSETTADEHIKIATLKYRLKKYYEN